MRMVKRRIPKPFSKPIDTYCTIQGVEQEVLVEVDYQPDEPDVGVSEGIEVVSVWFEDAGCQLGNMTDDEVDELTQRLWEDQPTDDDYGDYLYEQERDRRMEEDR